jgi:hypothetical protein
MMILFIFFVVVTISLWTCPGQVIEKKNQHQQQINKIKQINSIRIVPSSFILTENE